LRISLELARVHADHAGLPEAFSAEVDAGSAQKTRRFDKLKHGSMQSDHAREVNH
jgi:hypothetical protein